MICKEVLYLDRLLYRERAGSSDSKEFTCSAEDPSSIFGLERSLEEEMATHSNILARKIPWTEDPGGLQSIGSQKARHN